MQFKYYVLNYNWNGKRVEPFNIFSNWHLNDETEKEIKKYLRSPNKYEYVDSIFHDRKKYYGFDALVQQIGRLIRWQEWGRREYEISVGDAFEDDCGKLEKWDCYQQCEPNLEMIAREVLWQYKNNKKDKEREME
jgi:hypothetical protein